MSEFQKKVQYVANKVSMLHIGEFSESEIADLISLKKQLEALLMSNDKMPKPGATPFLIESIRMLAPNYIGIANFNDDEINRAVLAFNPDWHKPFDWIGFNIFLKAAKEESHS